MAHSRTFRSLQAFQDGKRSGRREAGPLAGRNPALHPDLIFIETSTGPVFACVLWPAVSTGVDPPVYCRRAVSRPWHAVLCPAPARGFAAIGIDAQIEAYAAALEHSQDTAHPAVPCVYS